mgnify:CR=1 FL=1
MYILLLAGIFKPLDSPVAGVTVIASDVVLIETVVSKVKKIKSVDI